MNPQVWKIVFRPKYDQYEMGGAPAWVSAEWEKFWPLSAPEVPALEMRRSDTGWYLYYPHLSWGAPEFGFPTIREGRTEEEVRASVSPINLRSRVTTIARRVTRRTIPPQNALPMPYPINAMTTGIPRPIAEQLLCLFIEWVQHDEEALE